MGAKVRWGILSTSHHAALRVIPAIHASPSGEVVAVASRNAAQAQFYADGHHIPYSYGDYESLLEDSDVDVIYIPLPNNLHKEWSIRAAQAGKHVLCEKPIALNAAEAEEMAQAFRLAKRKLAEAFQWRHHPQATLARNLVREGKIGAVRLINAGFTFSLTRPENVRWKPELGGGALYDVGCYPVALTRFITGQEPISVTAQAHWHKSGVDDWLAATLLFPDGTLAHIDCGFALPLRRYYEICGSDGILRVEYAYNPIGDRPCPIQRCSHDYQLLELIDVGMDNCYTLMVEDFNRAVLEDRELPFPAEDAVGNMRTIDAIYHSARTGGVTNVENV